MPIKEDYVSFETAKLMKEKWFNEDSWFHYDNDGDIVTRGYRLNHPDDIPAWSHQVVMKWLRNIYNLSIEVYRTACGYIGCIVAVPSGTDIKFLEDDGDDLPSGQYTTWEKACEAAIKYCLKNLI